MRWTVLISVLLSTAACTYQDPAVVELATKLAQEGGYPMTDEIANRYIECGIESLSGAPKSKITSALKADNQPARWAILGSDALDDYVATCRKSDLDHAARSSGNGVIK